MKKKDIFFASLFLVSFLVCGVVITVDYLCSRAEIKRNNGCMEPIMEATVHGQEDAAEEGRRTEPPEEESPKETDEESQAEQPDTNESPEIESVQENHSEEEASGDSVQKPLEFVNAGYEYFDDALFIGDSRTVGLMEYGNLGKASFFADSGMSVFKLEKRTISMPNEGKVSFDEVLGRRQYGKIYLMLGINELGYRFESISEKYRETLEKIKMSQSDAVIYLCANMHVTEEQSQKDEIYNNGNVDRVNEMIAGLADNETIFYIDVNELFDDEGGSLSTEYASDAFHVYGKYYMDWVDWLCTKTIPLPGEG